MNYKYLAFALSGIIIVSGIINITVRKGLNYGIDFAGGSLIRLMLKNQTPISDIRKLLTDAGFGKSRIQRIGETEREYLIRTMQILTGVTEEQELEAHEIIANRIIDALRLETGKSALERGLKDLNSIDETELTLILAPSFPDKASETAHKIISYRTSEGIIQDFTQIQQELEVSQDIISYLNEKTFLGRLTVLSKETVGPQVGHDLRKKATQATVWALIGMLIYIGIRFKLAFGVSAIITLAHDVLVTLGIFSFTSREINLTVIAAILTLVGYSLNDTIVIFDRIRDNLKILRKHDFQEMLDVSLNQTLSRTVITSGTTFLTVLALFLFGGEVINDFAFTMVIGIIVGTYSSIYQSCPLLYFWKRIFKPKKGMGR